jgi:hypothetical protein
MSNLYRLVGVGNAELVAGLSKLVQQSNGLTAQVLAHWVELDERKLHLQLGFSSLFAYCVEGLGMSEGTAGRRVTAARVCRRFPDAFERVARGELHLCALCALAPHLNEQNATELFEASKGKTRRQIEELLAVRFPRPDVREQIRRLPTRGPTLTPFATPERAPGSGAQKCPPSRSFGALGDLQDSHISLEGALKAAEYAASDRPEALELPVNSPPAQAVHAEPEPASIPAARPRPRSRELEPLSADRFGVRFTADLELRDLIERARALALHRIPKDDLAALMKLMAASFVKHEEKRRFGIGAKSRRRSGEVKPSRPRGVAEPLGRTSANSQQVARPGGASDITAPAAPLDGASDITAPAAPLDGASDMTVPVAPPSGASDVTALRPGGATEITAPAARLDGTSDTSEQAGPPGGVSLELAAPPIGAAGTSEPAAPPGGAAGPSYTGEAATRAARPSPLGRTRRNRYLSVQVRRAVHERDGGQCAFISADGRRCNARGLIQFDHLIPFARNGSSDVPNLRLLCTAHNQLHAQKCFGISQIAAKVAARTCGDADSRPRKLDAVRPRS